MSRCAWASLARFHFCGATTEMLALLTVERDKLTDRIEVLIPSRDATTEYLEEIAAHRHPDP